MYLLKDLIKFIFMLMDNEFLTLSRRKSRITKMYSISYILCVQVFSDGTLYFDNVGVHHIGNYTCYDRDQPGSKQVHELNVYCKFNPFTPTDHYGSLQNKGWKCFILISRCSTSREEITTHYTIML